MMEISKSSRVGMISLKPEYATMVFSGYKSVELRRVRPNMSNGDILFIYMTSPVMALIGTVDVQDVIELDLQSLWHEYGEYTGISEVEFYEYYEGKETGIAILLGRIHELDETVSLDRLREDFGAFQPPQCYYYFDDCAHSLRQLRSYFPNSFGLENELHEMTIALK
ncbi:MAG: ASCH domain-containing protein [Candidatus Kapaibacterium sp.]